MLYILYFSCLSLEKDYFPYKLFNKLFFLPQSTCQFSLSVIKINYNMRITSCSYFYIHFICMRTIIGSSGRDCILINLFPLYFSKAGFFECNLFWMGQ